MPRTPKMSAVTHDQLREALANHPTKDDLAKALANHPTKDDLAKALANHPTKDDLATSAGALEHRFLLALRAQSAEMAQHINAILAHARGEVAVLDDKYRDVPDRVSRLEELVKP